MKAKPKWDRAVATFRRWQRNRNFAPNFDGPFINGWFAGYAAAVRDAKKPKARRK